MIKRYVLKKVKFNMKADSLDKAFENFQKYFLKNNEINLRDTECISDVFAEFDLEVVEDKEGNIVDFEPIDGEMSDSFYIFLKSIEKYVENRSEIVLEYIDDDFERTFLFQDNLCMMFDTAVLKPRIKNEIDVYIPSEEERKFKFQYQLLDRCRCDCEFYLGYGRCNEEYLWAGTIKEHIEKMKELYCILPVKPEWLTMEKIKEYEKFMMIGGEW